MRPRRALRGSAGRSSATLRDLPQSSKWVREAPRRPERPREASQGSIRPHYVTFRECPARLRARRSGRRILPCLGRSRTQVGRHQPILAGSNPHLAGTNRNMDEANLKLIELSPGLDDANPELAEANHVWSSFSRTQLKLGRTQPKFRRNQPKLRRMQAEWVDLAPIFAEPNQTRRYPCAVSLPPSQKGHQTRRPAPPPIRQRRLAAMRRVLLARVRLGAGGAHARAASVSVPLRSMIDYAHHCNAERLPCAAKLNCPTLPSTTLSGFHIGDDVLVDEE